MIRLLLSTSCLAMCMILASGCGSEKKQGVKQYTDKTALVGSDRDNHGCIGSAGYQWSELLKDCIRPFEKGVKLLNADSSMAAYAVFNSDSSKVELFMPKEKQHHILVRADNKGMKWKSSANRNLRLINGKQGFIIEKKEEAIFTQK